MFSVYPWPLVDAFDAEACLKKICRSICTSVIDIKFSLHTEKWFLVYN
jgi:hypothetical protein